MQLARLGDPPGWQGDDYYTGDDSDNPLSLAFYRNKVGEFQAVMNALEATLMSAYGTQALFPDDAELAELIAEIEGKRNMVGAAASAINLASEGLNAAGVRFPVVSMPGGLAGVPLVAVAAAVAGAAALITWGNSIIRAVLARQTALAAAAAIEDPVKRDAVLAQIAQTTAAMQSADNPVSQVAGAVKWIAIGVAVFLGYRLIQGAK